MDEPHNHKFLFINKSLDRERQNGTAPDSQEATLEKDPGFPLPEKLCGFSEPKLGAGFGLLFTNTRPWRALWLLWGKAGTVRPAMCSAPGGRWEMPGLLVTQRRCRWQSPRHSGLQPSEGILLTHQPVPESSGLGPSRPHLTLPPERWGIAVALWEEGPPRPAFGMVTVLGAGEGGDGRTQPLPEGQTQGSSKAWSTEGTVLTTCGRVCHVGPLTAASSPSVLCKVSNWSLY